MGFESEAPEIFNMFFLISELLLNRHRNIVIVLISQSWGQYRLVGEEAIAPVPLC